MTRIPKRKDRGIAVLGCGPWGLNHLRTWSKLGVSLTVCDTDASRLAQVRHDYPHARLCSVPEEIFGDPSIDAVVIATPPDSHALLAVQAVESGKDVLVEKPMALTVAEGEKVARLARDHDAVVMVNHLLEYHPAFLKLQELIEKGELGRITYLYSNRLNFGRVRTRENALWSFAPHDVALMLRIVGRMPEEVVCTGEAFLNRAVADTTLMSLGFENDVRAHIFVSWLHPFKEHRFVVVGDRQMAVIDDTAPWSEKLVLYPHQVDWMDGRVPIARKAEAAAVPLEEQEPLLAACEHFIECVTNRSRPRTDANRAVQVLRVLESGSSSLEHGGKPVRISVPLGEADPQQPFVHETARVDPGASIGPGTSVWHFSHVMDDAVVGSDCTIGQNVFVSRNVIIGNRVKIQNNVSVYEGVELEDDVFCGPSAVFTNVLNPRSAVERKDEFKRTLVQRGATLGANCTIVCGNSIGRSAFIAAGAVVTSDVPDYALMVGVPARPAGFVCECGVGLVVEDRAAKCTACARSFVLLPDGLHLEEAP